MTGIGSEFMERTKYRHLGPSAQQRGEPQPPLGVLFRDGAITELPAVESVAGDGVDLRRAIEARRSVRQYSETPLTFDEVTLLLWLTQGVRERLGERATLRTVPSAGARHPFETVILANRVDGVEPGLHQYDALEHRLVDLGAPADVAEQMMTACLGQEMILSSAATFVWVADPIRTTWRYGERGHRYIHLDAGHVCQNLYLAAGSIGAGVCAIGAFDDDEVNRVIGVDGETRFAVYVATVGKLVSED